MTYNQLNYQRLTKNKENPFLAGPQEGLKIVRAGMGGILKQRVLHQLDLSGGLLRTWINREQTFAKKSAEDKYFFALTFTWIVQNFHLNLSDFFFHLKSSLQDNIFLLLTLLNHFFGLKLSQIKKNICLLFIVLGKINSLLILVFKTRPVQCSEVTLYCIYSCDLPYGSDGSD